jgi:hypothetical protein
VSRQALLVVCVFCAGALTGWFVRSGTHPQAGDRFRSDRHTVTINRPAQTGGKRVTTRLVINRIESLGRSAIEFAPVDDDTYWMIDVGDAVYFCSSRD